MTYEERIERLKKRVNYQGSPEYIISTAEEESARDRLTEIRNKYSSEAKQKEQEISSGQYNATAYSAAVKAAQIKNNSKITATSSSLTAKNYEQQKEELKNEKKEALGSRISTWFNNIGTHINVNATDEEKKKASLNYQNAKNEHQQLSDALDTLKENKWTSSQEKNAKLISSNSELQKLVEQARNAKINADSAQSTSNVFKNYSDPNNPASNLAVQEQQKTYQTAYKKYSDIVSKINDLGYDAESLIDTYTRQKNLEETEQFTGEVSKFADEHPILASGAYVALNSAQTAALPEIIEKGIESKINDEYIPIDVNSGKFGATNIRDTIAETTSANIEDEVNEKTDSEFLAGASSFLYRTGLSMGDFASLAALPKSVSLAIMGSSAAATTAKDATERGISADDALATATAAAAAEIFFEKFSLEGLQALKASGKTGIKNAVKDILKQSFTEGSEEFFTDISNAITDQIINGSDSALSQQYKSLIENGATSTEAKKQVAVDFGKQLGQSFLGGAISGGVMGSGATLLNNIEANSAYRAEGAAIKNMGTDAVTAVINEGLAQKNTSPAYKAASDMLTKNAETDTFEANLDVSNKKLGQLQQLNVQANDISEFSKAVSNEHNAKSLVDTFSKIAQGENISNKEASEILSNKTARQALGNITDIDYIDNGNISSKKLINEVSKAYRASSMGTFSAATPIISSEKARNYINNGISYSHRIGAETKSDTIDKNIVLADGSSDVINSIDSVHNGKVYVKTSGGQVLSADDIRFNDITSEELYKSARVYGNTKTAKAYVFAYNDSTYNGSVADYNAGFNAVYKAQKLGKTFQQAYNYAIESGSHITELQAQTAYEAALTEDDTNIFGSSNETVIFDEAKSAKFNRALKSRTKAGATVIAENEITEYQQAEISLINEYAKSINKEVIVVDDTEEIGRPSSNGFYENGKIVLALNNSGNMLSAYFGHELFHSVKQSNPTQAKELQDYIINRLKEKESYNYEKRFASLADLYKENLERKTDTEIEEYINEEISANACFTVLSDEDNFVNLVKENKSLAQRVRDFFADFIQTIRNALVKISKSNPEYRALEGDIEAKQKILEMFDAALNSKQKNNTTRNDSVKYSLAENFDSEFDKVINGDDYYKNNVFIIGKMPSLYKKFGIDTSLDLTVTSKHLKNAVKEKNDEKHYHGLSKEIIKNAVLKLAEPAFVTFNENGVLYVTVSVTDSDNLPIMFIVKPNGMVQIKQRRIHSNHSLSIYGRNNTFSFINKQFFDHKMILANKNEATLIGQVLGKQFSDQLFNSDFTNNIAEYKNTVNTNNMQGERKYSLKRDSEGNKLSEQQQVYFKDSKVRDEDGNLLVVYHGTEENFTVFDRTNERANMDIPGDFFSPWKTDAQGYRSKLSAYYLNIKNPAPEAVAYKALNKFKGQNYAGIKAREYLEEMGYDGVNNSNEEYIAFYPEQIKLVDNVAPADNSDIRYLFKEQSDYSYDTLVSKPDMTVTVINDKKNYSPGKTTRENVVNAALVSAQSVGRKDGNGNTLVYVNDTDTEVLLSKRGLRHSLDRRLSIIAPVTENIGPIIKNSIKINELVPEFETIKNSYVLIGIAKNKNNEPYVVSFVVNRASNEVMSVDVLYAVNAKTEPAGSLSPELSSQSDVSLTGSTISISKLLDYVNKYYPDILPEDVLRHYGFSSRPGGTIGESALYSLKEKYFYSNILKDNADVEEFDETGYNIINTTGKKGYSKIKSEIMTWDADRHLNEIRCGYLGGSFIIYKMLDTDSRDIILYRPKSAFAKTEYAKIRRQYNDNGRKFARPDDVVKVIRNKRNGSNDNNSLSGQKSGEYRENDKLHNSTVREKGHSDGRRNAENGNNDNLSKGRYSLKEKYYDSNILNENVDVEEFDETGYSIINTTGKKGYSKLKSEVMTWDGDRYLDEIRLIRIDDRFYIYKMLSDDTRDVIIYKPRSNQAKELYKEMRENYVVRNYRRPVDAIEIVRIKHGHGNGNNVLFRRQPGESKSDDKFHNSQIRGKRHGDGRRDAENDHNDNLQKGRYSLKDEYFDSNILKENEELKEAADDVLNMLQLVSTENSELRKAFDIRTVRSVEDSSVAKVAAFLKKQYDSTYKKSDLVSNLAGLYNYISNAGEDIDNEYIWRTAKDISANILANTYFKDTTMYDDSKQLRDYIRSQTIRVSDSVKNDITDYNAFRKRNFGRMRLSSDSGIPLDTIYRELSSENPEFFPPDAVLSEQLENIENFFVSTAPVYYNGAEMIAEGNGLSLDEYSNIVASDIFDQYFNVPEVKSFVSEKNIQELNELQKSYETQIEDMRSIYRERYEEQLRSLREENQQRIDKLKEQNDKTLSRLTEKHLDEMAKQKAHFKDISKRGTQRRNASKLRESIRRSLKKIAKLGASADKKNHIPNSIIDSVKSLVDVINLDNTKKDELISVRLNRIKTSFDTAKNNSEYTDISEAYNDFIENEIIELQAKTEGKTLKQLTNDDLESIDRVLKATVKAISNINKLFKKGRTDTVNNYANSVKSELSAYGKEKIFDGVLRSFAYNSMKPEYFFEYLGSDTLLELYNDLRNGEDTWAVDVNEAKNKADKIRKKYDWNNWRDETLTFSTISGDIELDLQERLAIYANSLGEHTKSHLLGGGFKYQPKKPHGLEKLKKQKNDNQAHKLSEEDVITIVDTLTDEQTSYVKEMIDYMSTEMARKGNDVSKELYDVELFKEDTYYPAKVDRESIVVSSKEVRPEKQIKNAGFTNAAVVNAKQPIILMNFDDVWATHIDEMAKYHAFVLPLDNFDRVFNSYQVVDDKYESVKEFIKNSFGSKAVNYIDDLIRDINGGIIQETGVDIISKLTGLFKKNAVFASISVVVQQPSAIGRALSEIDTKYLAKSTGKGFDRKLYEEMKRYAPVAQIKEMGYFDTNMAQSTVEFLNSRNYETVKEKVSAFVKDGSFRDDALSFFASKVDEITWTQIWQAVKCETENKYPGLSKEDNFKTAGKRFTEIITKTQVYDSVFSRSGLMRSRDLAVKNAMAFMAEPTTALNMFTNAIVQVKRGKMSKTHGAKVLDSLVASSVLNSLLQSIVTSARNVDPDDDKEWAEIYLAHLLPNFIENVNPLNQIAFVKDIVNIFKGYDVERADMNLFSDFVDAFRKLNNDKVSVEDKITGFAGAISAFLGIPLKNIIRDVKASFNTAESLLNGVKFNSTESYEVFEEEMNSTLGFELFKPDFDKAVRAIKKGNYSDYEKYAENVYGSNQAYDLLYEVLKKYGYKSDEYQKAESLCISVKKENGVANPNPLNSIKNKCIKEYSGLKQNGTYAQAEEARQRCIQVYGSADDVAKALEKYEKSNKN